MSDLLALFLELQQAGAETRAARLAALPDEQRDLLERMLRADEEDTDERWLGAVDEEAAAGELPAGLPKRYESSTTPPARGGMGVVHRVRDAQLERHVALKLAHPALLQTPGYRDLFLREPLVPSMLQHPGIIPIYDQAFTEDGTPYYTMRFVSDRTLADEIEAGQGAVRERAHQLDLFLKVCDAVAFAHSRGIIHRDLKPSNISLDEFGSVTLLDWGIAVAYDAPDAPPVPAAITASQRDVALDLQTRLYAPEEGIVDPSGDLYSLGVILAQILLGETSAERALAAVRMVEDDTGDAASDPADPSLGALLTLCRQALQPTATGRRKAFETVSAFADAIRAAQVPALSLLQVQLQHARSLPPSRALDLLDEVQGGLSAIPAGTQAHTELSEEVRSLRAEKSRALAKRRTTTTIAILLPLLVGSLVWVWWAEGRRAESEAEARRITRLTDAPAVRQRIAEAGRLWPASPEAAARMDAWIEAVEDLLSRRSVHEQALADLRQMATEEPLEASWDAAIRWHEKDLEDLEAFLRRLPADAADRNGVEVRAQWVRRQLASLREERAATVVLHSEEDPVELALLQDLLQGLDVLGKEGGLLPSMRLRRASAGGFSSEAAWQAVMARLASRSRADFRGVEPIRLLEPLGVDPASGLEEFFLRGTGSRPVRGEDRLLRRERDFGVVMVLVPGGRFVRGSVAPYRSFAGLQAPESDERPLRVVSISPVYVSKYELTQAQWERLTEGDRPSHDRPDSRREGFPPGHTRDRHNIDDPVESVTWSRCREVLTRYGLRLPTEAEWEYAAWGGAGTPPTDIGSDEAALAAFLEGLQGSFPGYWRHLEPSHDPHLYGNFTDAAFVDGDNVEAERDDRFNDGHHLHAWVGAFKPNGYGLHDMHGNVSEWVRDKWDNIYYQYSRDFDPPGGMTDFPTTGRCHKGGSWATPPHECHMADRKGHHPDHPRRDIGVRPAMSITPPR